MSLHCQRFSRRILASNFLRTQSRGSPASSGIFLDSSISRKWYTPFTPEEQEKEKARVHHLSPEDKEQELRKLNREISRLEVLRGINNGELFTWSGRYKALMRDYGIPLFVYYWVTWTSTGLLTYAAIEIGGLDAMQMISNVDNYTGFDLASKVDPQLGKIGLTLVANEMLEPIRLPFVVATLKPLMDTINPPKY
jgi:hypothetical protein